MAFNFGKLKNLAELINADIRKFVKELYEKYGRTSGFSITPKDVTDMTTLVDRVESNYAEYLTIIANFPKGNEPLFHVVELIDTPITTFLIPEFITKHMMIWRKILTLNYNFRYKGYNAIWKNMRKEGYDTGFSLNNNTKRTRDKQYNTKMQKLFMNANKRYRNLKFPRLNTREQKQEFWNYFRSTTPESSTGGTTPSLGGSTPGGSSLALSDSTSGGSSLALSDSTSGGSSPGAYSFEEEFTNSGGSTPATEEELRHATEELEASRLELEKLQREVNEEVAKINAVSAALARPLGSGSVRERVEQWPPGLKGGKRGKSFVKRVKSRQQKTRRRRY
jgi:hypothetical protein